MEITIAEVCKAKKNGCLFRLKQTPVPDKMETLQEASS
jgi:hypothetical protein